MARNIKIAKPALEGKTNSENMFRLLLILVDEALPTLR